MNNSSGTMQNFLRELTFIVFYRKWLIILTCLVILGASVALAYMLPPVYQSSAKFFLNITENMDPLQKERFYSIKDQMVRLLQNQKELIFSQQVMEDAVLAVYPDESGEALQKRIEKVRENTIVSPPKGETFAGSSVFYLTYEGKDPSMVHKLSTAMMQSYIEAYAELSKSKADYSHTFFGQQVEQLGRDLEKASTRLRNYEMRHSADLVDILNLESGKTNVEVGPKALLTESQRKRQDLEQEIDALQTTIASLETEARRSAIPVVLPEMEGAGKTLSAYRIKVAQLQLQISELKTQFTDSYQPLAELQSELSNTIELLREEFFSLIRAKRIALQSLQAELGEVQRTITMLEQRITSTAQERSTYEGLKQEYNLVKDAYSNAVEQLEQARMALSLNQDEQNLTLVEEPQPPLEPVRPNRILICILGLLGGLLTGLALALTADYFDHTIKTPEDIKRYLGVPCLGSISHVS